MVEMKKKDRLGEVRYCNKGLRMEIMEYNEANDIVVGLEGGYTVKTQYKHFKARKVKHNGLASVYGVGAISEGDYKVWENGENTKEYQVWTNMLKRCYSDKYHERRPTYKGCEVYRGWHCFQVFAHWMKRNYYEIDGESIHLDKDILSNGKKIYSPTTCLFVPNRINQLFKGDKVNTCQVKEVAEMYRGKIPERVYTALLQHT